MPLYELIVIARCGTPTNTANLLRTLSQAILERGGNIRNVQILGERILNKQLIGKDQAKHLIGRYVSVLYDGHPSQYQLIVKQAEMSFEALRINHFKVKDFISEATQFTKDINEEAPFIRNSKIESQQYARALEVLKEERSKI